MELAAAHMEELIEQDLVRMAADDWLSGLATGKMLNFGQPSGSGPTAKTHSFVSVDYSALELRILKNYAKFDVKATIDCYDMFNAYAHKVERIPNPTARTQ